MATEHLTYFKVQNFKRFETFEMDDIGQFNLILGDNNVGKTSVLEALLFNENPDIFSSYLGSVIYHFRGFTTFKDHYLDLFLNKKTGNFTIKFSSSKKNDENVILTKKNGNWIYSKSFYKDLNGSSFKNLGFNQISYPPEIPYIPLNLKYDQDLINYYTQYIQISKKAKQDLVDSLKAIIPTIETIEVSTAQAFQPILLIAQTNTDAVLPLAMFGDGMIKLFRILCNVVKYKGKRLMIDEIDLGIHFSRMKIFWKTILKAAHENDVQLFITTHNEECLQYFKEALEDEDMITLQAKARSFTLKEEKDGNVKALNYNFESFQHAIDMHINIRGGKAYV